MRSRAGNRLFTTPLAAAPTCGYFAGKTCSDEAPMRFGFAAETLTPNQLATLCSLRRRAGADCIRLTSLAGCGHPGGSLSSLDALILIYGCGHFEPQSPHGQDRDRVVVSHGHISPGVYATLGAFGFFDMQDCYDGFRRAGSHSAQLRMRSAPPSRVTRDCSTSRPTCWSCWATARAPLTCGRASRCCNQGRADMHSTT